MRDEELTTLRERVDCRVVLERAGWELDARESTRRAVKYRQGAGRIVIVTHEGRGWFDPLDGGRGDVLALAQHVWGGNLGHARKHLRPLAGVPPKATPAQSRGETPRLDAETIWNRARALRPGSSAWTYLLETRRLPATSIDRAVRMGVLREGIHGTVWAKHVAGDSRVTGWEMRGPTYKGFSRGGSKALFRLGHAGVDGRVAVTESAIDALSLAVIENWPDGTLYVSTAGGWGPATETALRGLLSRHPGLVAATDRGIGGDLLARRLANLAGEPGARFERLRPDAKDWNDQLRECRG